MDATAALPYAVWRTLFLDIVPVLTANGFVGGNVQVKIEGIAFGPEREAKTATGSHALGRQTTTTSWQPSRMRRESRS
jgi:hypothetical protein